MSSLALRKKSEGETFLQQDVSENVQKQSQLMGVISQNQAAYKQAFGYHEWRAACEVGIHCP